MLDDPGRFRVEPVSGVIDMHITAKLKGLLQMGLVMGAGCVAISPSAAVQAQERPADLDKFCRDT